MTADNNSILKLGRIKVNLDYASAAAEVRRLTGKGELRQAFEIARFAIGPQRFAPAEYYIDGLWRRDLSPSDRASLVSEWQSTKLNLRLSPLDRSGLQGLLADKLLTKLVLNAAGFPVLMPRAIFSGMQRIPGAERLANAKEIAAFLRREGALPAFGKPLHASLSIGAASFMALAGPGDQIVLGDGRTVQIEAVANEIAGNFARGYVFEPLIRLHPDVARIAGPAVGGLRIVTVRTRNDVETLYSVHRLPAAGAMIDAMIEAGPYFVALVEEKSGRMLRAQAVDALSWEGLERSPVTGERFDSVRLPFMSEAHEFALEAHRLLARPGLLGFDIALSAEGPIINEINSNPFHTTYQLAARRGLMNEEFKPKLEAALAAVKADGLGR